MTTIPKPRTLKPFRALRAIFRLQKALDWQKRQTEGAWSNRNRFCHAINVIGKEIVGPRINSFKGDCCSEDAVVRETRKLIEKLEAENAELRRALDSANSVLSNPPAKKESDGPET